MSAHAGASPFYQMYDGPGDLGDKSTMSGPAIATGITVATAATTTTAAVQRSEKKIETKKRGKEGGFYPESTTATTTTAVQGQGAKHKIEETPLEEGDFSFEGSKDGLPKSVLRNIVDNEERQAKKNTSDLHRAVVLALTSLRGIRKNADAREDAFRRAAGAHSSRWE